MEKYICFFCLIAFFGCANIVAPSGGPKDLSPPKLIKATPTNQSVNFTGTEILLEFDEYIQIENFDNIQISPMCEPSPRVLIRGKKIRIQLSCPLDTLATYTINFGNSIRDINEQNILQNFKYVFSKNQKLDSLSIRGKTNELYFNRAISGAIVGLFKQSDLELPHYYTFSNLGGDFLIENIKVGNYVLFSFVDENGDFKYNAGELASTPENINNLSLDKNLGLFTPKIKKPILEVKNTKKDMIYFKHDALEDSIVVLNTSGIWKRSVNYSLFYFKDSVNIIHYHYQGVADSVEVYNQELPKNIDLSTKIDLNMTANQSCLWIESNSPIEKLTKTKFSWDLRQSPITPQLINPFLIKIPITFNSQKIETVILHPGAIIDMYQLKNDSINEIINFNQEEYGAIKIHSDISNKRFMIELFNGDMVFKQVSFSDSIMLNWVKPGTYGIRVFIDENNNGVWDAGRITPPMASEKVKIYPELIKIRPNWEMELTISPPD